jgi:hypothetical protein
MIDKPVFEVLHLDDQPELVAWIPRAVNTWFWKNYTDDMKLLPEDEEEEDEEERCFRLRLRARQEVFDTRYRIVTDPDAVLKSLDDQFVRRTALIFLDQTIGENAAAGSDTYREIEQKFPDLVQRTFILSAYPNLVLAQLGWSDNEPRLIVKPAAPNTVLKHFITHLVSVATVSQDTKRELIDKVE